MFPINSNWADFELQNFALDPFPSSHPDGRLLISRISHRMSRDSNWLRAGRRGVGAGS
jgi:hypothetical protein